MASFSSTQLSVRRSPSSISCCTNAVVAIEVSLSFAAAVVEVEAVSVSLTCASVRPVTSSDSSDPSTRASANVPLVTAPAAMASGSMRVEVPSQISQSSVALSSTSSSVSSPPTPLFAQDGSGVRLTSLSRMLM